MIGAYDTEQQRMIDRIKCMFNLCFAAFEPNERFKTCFHTGSERTQHAFPTLGIIIPDRVFIRTTSFQRLKRNFLFSFAVLLTNTDHLLIMFHGTTKPPTVSYLMVLQVLTINLVAPNLISQELSFGIKIIVFPVWIYSGTPCNNITSNTVVGIVSSLG